MNANFSKGFIYILSAVVVGLVATFALHRYITEKTTVPTVATGQVAVAAGDIAPGTGLNGSLVKITSWPTELIPPQAASSVKQVDGRVAIVPITNGEPILMGKLAPEGTAAGLSGLLDEEKRALTVRVDDVTGVAGFIHPGDRVDILADIRAPEGQDFFSKTILQNIAVLTTGQVWEQKGDNKPAVVNTVTVELTPDQAEVLNLASNEGKIRMTLRNRRNMANVQTAGVSLSEIITPTVKKPEKAPVVAASGPRRDNRSVEVIKGLEREQVSVVN